MKASRLLRLAALTLAFLLLFTACAGLGELAGLADEVLDAMASGEASQPDDAYPPDNASEPPDAGQDADAPDEDGVYSSRDDVALYIYTYGHLPSNFITKAKAREAGWEGGSLEPYYPGYSIGGDRFGNYEGLLPEAEGRSYTECDIDTAGADSRGAKRLVFSNDGLIYYTDDHYESFTLLYGEE